MTTSMMTTLLGHNSNWEDKDVVQKLLNAPSIEGSIKFLQYNIQLSGLDEPGHLWNPDRKDAVLAILRYSDIMELQEVSHQQYLNIREELDAYDFIGYNTVTGKDLLIPAIATEEGLVIGWRKENISLVKDLGLTWFSPTPDCPSTAPGCAFPKAMLRCQLQVGTKSLVIHNSHFAHDDVADNNHPPHPPQEGLISPRVSSAQQELDLLPTDMSWISAGDRNFHSPRDIEAYQLYLNRGIQDSRHQSKQHGTKTTFFGYELHPRCNLVDNNDFVREYYLDVLFHSEGIRATDWISIIGEYNTDGKILPFGPVTDTSKRRYASDHAGILVKYIL